MADDSIAQRLLHPVYLDVPMMVSFLAALKGGVSFEDETTRRSSTTTQRDKEAAGKIGIPALGSLLGFDASGRMGRKDTGEAGEEVKAVRQHTAASLFNALHETLWERELIRTVTGSDELDAIKPGDVVEVTGEFAGNPLEELVAFFAQALPYFAMSEGDQEALPDIDTEAVAAEADELVAEAKKLQEEATEARRSGNPARRGEAEALERRAQELADEANTKLEGVMEQLAPLLEKQQQNMGVQMFLQMREDLATTPVHDSVIKGADLDTVLTLSSEFFTDATSAYLRAGVFSAVGKVTRVLRTEGEINLLRRTVLGAAGPDLGRDLIDSTVKEGQLQIETFDPLIKAPALQILPLAVYI